MCNVESKDSLSHLSSKTKLSIASELFQTPPVRGFLSLESLNVLTLPLEDREDDALSRLITESEGFEFIQKFDMDVRRELAKRMILITAERNQFLLQQGSPPDGIFLLVSGVVSLRYNIRFSEGSNLCKQDLDVYTSNLETGSIDSDEPRFKNDDLESKTGQSSPDQGINDSSEISSLTEKENDMTPKEEVNYDKVETASNQQKLESNNKLKDDNEVNIQNEDMVQVYEGEETSDSVVDVQQEDATGSNLESNLAEQDGIDSSSLNQEDIAMGSNSLKLHFIHPDVIAKSQWPEKVLRRGSLFGHEDILKDRPSTIDAIAVGYSQLLLLKKEDFRFVFKVLDDEHELKSNFLHSIDTLLKFSWTEKEFRVLEIFSELASYDNQVEVYNGSNVYSHWSYFVAAGELNLVRDFGRIDTRPDLKEPLKFETVQEGFFFGVGESFGKNRVFSTPASAVLLVPRLVLLVKNRQLLKKMAQDLERSFPSDQEILEIFATSKKTKEGLTQMLRNMMKDKPHRFVDRKKEQKKPRFVKYV